MFFRIFFSYYRPTYTFAHALVRTDYFYSIQGAALWREEKALEVKSTNLDRSKFLIKRYKTVSVHEHRRSHWHRRFLGNSKPLVYCLRASQRRPLATRPATEVKLACWVRQREWRATHLWRSARYTWASDRVRLFYQLTTQKSRKKSLRISIDLWLASSSTSGTQQMPCNALYKLIVYTIIQTTCNPLHTVSCIDNLQDIKNLLPFWK